MESQEIKTLSLEQIKKIREGSLTIEDIKNVRTNGDGWLLLYTKMDNEALALTVKNNLENCKIEWSKNVYDYILKTVLVPILLGRIESLEDYIAGL